MHSLSKVVLPIIIQPSQDTETAEVEAAVNSLRTTVQDWFLAWGYALTFHSPIPHLTSQSWDHFAPAPFDRARALVEDHYPLGSDHLALIFLKGAGVAQLVDSKGIGHYGWANGRSCIVAWDALLGYQDEQPGPLGYSPKNMLLGVVEHELGHCLGFPHLPEVPNSVMWAWWLAQQVSIPRPVESLRLMSVGGPGDPGECPLPEGEPQ